MKKVLEFFKNVNKELSKVRWSTKKEMMVYSMATIIFIVIVSLFFLTIDFILATVKTWV